MEIELQNNSFREEDQHFLRSSKQTSSIQNKKKNAKLQDDKVVAEKQVKEEKGQAENIAPILMHTYDNNFYGEDDTSQPTSCAAPIIPIETTRKKKKRKRSQISICLINCR